MLYVQSKHNVRKADGAPFRMETKLHHLIYASEEVAHTINNKVKITQDIAIGKENHSTYCDDFLQIKATGVLLWPFARDDCGIAARTEGQHIYATRNTARSNAICREPCPLQPRSGASKSPNPAS